MDQKEFDDRVKRHVNWIYSLQGGRRMDIRNEDLSLVLACERDISAAWFRCVNFHGANLHGVNFSFAMFVDVDFSGANLSRSVFTHALFHGVCLVRARLSWNSPDLLSEVLWQAAEGDVEKQQLAAFIGRRRDWCWENWVKLDHPCKEWAFKVLAACVVDGDDSPTSLRRIAAGASVELALSEWESCS